MEMYGKIRCVTFPELVSQGRILSKPNYDKKVREGKIRVVRPGKGAGSYALIDYTSLPALIREAYDRLYPNALEEMKEQLMSNIIRSDSRAVQFYRTYQPAISLERQAEYVLNAEVMNELVRVEKETGALHSKCGYSRKSIVWETVKVHVRSFVNTMDTHCPRPVSAKNSTLIKRSATPPLSTRTRATRRHAWWFPKWRGCC